MDGWYDGFGLYHGPKDPRFLVPKRIPMMGWTINVSHPYAPVIILVFGALLGAAFLAKVLA
jgi:uncharacterized membrane protein